MSLASLFYPSRFLASFLPRALSTAFKVLILFLASPLIALFGWVWLFVCLGAAVRIIIGLRRIAGDRLCCPAGHHVHVYGKWRCPVCHGIWQGAGHRCACCQAPMNYLSCQEPGCGLAARLPRFC